MSQKLVFIALSALVALFLAGCSSGNQQLKDGWWKYGRGYHVGDVIDFNKDFSLSGDTLYQAGQKVGVLLRKKQRWLDGQFELEIRSLDGQQSGVYYRK